MGLIYVLPQDGIDNYNKSGQIFFGLKSLSCVTTKSHHYFQLNISISMSVLRLSILQYRSHLERPDYTAKTVT
ncbi:MAG: hypothetical protein JKY22_00995 [Flavobacteriaceae bacterium]|nr:hypothetical protein [Flavobacteriaceae bacterium]